MTALRFQTGGRHQTSPASLREIGAGSWLILVKNLQNNFAELTESKTGMFCISQTYPFHAKAPLAQAGTQRDQTPTKRGAQLPPWLSFPLSSVWQWRFRRLLLSGVITLLCWRKPVNGYFSLTSCPVQLGYGPIRDTERGLSETSHQVVSVSPSSVKVISGLRGLYQWTSRPLPFVS